MKNCIKDFFVLEYGQGGVMGKEIIVTAAMDGRKIEYVLSGDLSLSGNIIKKLKATGGIQVNGESVHTDRLLAEGEVLRLIFPEEFPGRISPEEMELDILYEDDDLLAVNKRAGMETHPSRGNYRGTLANGVMHYFKNAFTFRVITRLDRETSGVVLIAKNMVSAHRLNEAMRLRKIIKEYVAVVEGEPKEKSGIIDAPIKRGEGIRRIVAEDGKEAITEYAVEKTVNNLSLVRLRPLSGRTHQIRVHLAHIGVPIYGDWLYGNQREGERVRLHCAKVGFEHPSTGEQITIEAPIPGDIMSLIK